MKIWKTTGMLCLCMLLGGCLTTSEENRCPERRASYRPGALEREGLAIQRLGAGAVLPLTGVGTLLALLVTYEDMPPAVKLIACPMFLIVGLPGYVTTAPFQILGGACEMVTCSQFKGMAYPWEYREAYRHAVNNPNALRFPSERLPEEKNPASQSEKNPASQSERKQPQSAPQFDWRQAVPQFEVQQPAARQNYAPQLVSQPGATSFDQGLQSLMDSIYLDPAITQQSVGGGEVSRYQTPSQQSGADLTQQFCNQILADTQKIVSGDYTPEDEARWEREARVWNAIGQQAEGRLFSQKLQFDSTRRTILNQADWNYRQETGRDFDADRPPDRDSPIREDWERCNRIHGIFK